MRLLHDPLPLLPLLLTALMRGADAASEATRKQLHDSLLNNYDHHVRPVTDSAALTHVTFHMDIHNADLWDDSTLRVETWTYWEWKDAFLKWDPSRYEGITEVEMDSSSIWMPELVHISRGRISGSMRSVMSEGGRCRVTSAGDVSCMAEAEYHTHCAIDLTDWPYDSHMCFLSFVNWLDLDDEVSITLRNGTGFSLKYVRTTPEWQLVSVTSEQIPRQNNDERRGYRKIDFYFTFKRHSDAYTATTVAPAAVLAMATAATLLVPPWEPERFSVGLCLFAAHYVAVEDLYHNFAHMINVPRLVLLYRDSMLMTSAALILAIIMRALIESDIDAPTFIVTTLDKVPTWPWGLSLLAEPRDEAVGRKASRSSAVWRQLSTLLDRCCFCFYCLVLLILLALLLP